MWLAPIAVAANIEADVSLPRLKKRLQKHF